MNKNVKQNTIQNVGILARQNTYLGIEEYSKQNVSEKIKNELRDNIRRKINGGIGRCAGENIWLNITKILTNKIK